MKQKIIIEVPMHCDKCRSKAMQIAVAMEGVLSVSIECENNQLVIIGEGVDSVSLTTSLRKKFSYAKIVMVEQVQVEEVQEENANQDGEAEDQPTGEFEYQPPDQGQPCHDESEDQPNDKCEYQFAVEGQPCYYYPDPRHYYICRTVYDPPPTNCSIL